MKEISLKDRGQGIPFQRLRRITGYISTLEKFNTAKQAEERERVKHSEELDSAQTVCANSSLHKYV